MDSCLPPHPSWATETTNSRTHVDVSAVRSHWLLGLHPQREASPVPSWQSIWEAQTHRKPPTEGQRQTCGCWLGERVEKRWHTDVLAHPCRRGSNHRLRNINTKAAAWSHSSHFLSHPSLNLLLTSQGHTLTTLWFLKQLRPGKSKNPESQKSPGFLSGSRLFFVTEDQKRETAAAVSWSLVSCHKTPGLAISL